MEKLTYLEVGVAKGLIGKRLKLYVAYMKERWAEEEHMQCISGYADEWAERFLSEREFEASDSIGQVVLVRLLKEQKEE
jgi:hypothetical protein